jgi:hypothetical protein
MLHKAPASNQAAEPSGSEKSLYIAAIQLWVDNVQVARALERNELAQLEGIQRFIAVSKGYLPNAIRVCRRNKKADSRLAVLAVIHLCSDNDDGLCRLSVKRFAQILYRTEEAIRVALRDLEDGGEIAVEHSRRGNSYWPKIDAEAAYMSPSIGWLADALSEKPHRVGRPEKTTTSKVGDISKGEKSPKQTPEIPPSKPGTYITKGNRSKFEDHEATSYGSCFRGSDSATVVTFPSKGAL